MSDQFKQSPSASPSVTGSAGPGEASVVIVEIDVEPAPKVDEALAAMRARSSSERDELALAELRVMSAEVSQMVASARQTKKSSKGSGGNVVQSVRADIEGEIRANPIGAVLAAALFGYVFGIAR